MGDPSRIPFLAHRADKVDGAVQSALDGAVLWVCRTGKIDTLYQAWPCFNTRSRALHDLLIHWIGSKFVDQGEVNLVCHCHYDAVSLVLQVNRVKGQNEPAADATIPMSARRRLAEEGALHLTNAIR